MSKRRLGRGVIIGKNVNFGENVTVWNYVVIGDNSQIGEGTLVGSFCDIGKEVTIGRNCNIQAHTTISNGCQIGDNVFIAPNTSLLNDRYPKSSLLTPPIVKSDAVIGGGVTILPGVVIGKKAVVAGGSVVTKDVPTGMVVKGVPATVVMTLDEYKAKRKKYIDSRRSAKL
jgi:UDP-2-acetamido-3-amino-2,3-dideoxy-glucuronate N-acetyltransferase